MQAYRMQAATLTFNKMSALLVLLSQILSTTDGDSNDSYFWNFGKAKVTLLQSVRIVAKTNPAKFQKNQLIFSAASSPLRFKTLALKYPLFYNQRI